MSPLVVCGENMKNEENSNTSVHHFRYGEDMRNQRDVKPDRYGSDSRMWNKTGRGRRHPFILLIVVTILVLMIFMTAQAADFDLWSTLVGGNVNKPKDNDPATEDPVSEKPVDETIPPVTEMPSPADETTPCGFLEQPNRVMSLTPEEAEELFLVSGDASDEEWKDEQVLRDRLRKQAETYIQLLRPMTLTKDVDQGILNDVARASKLENGAPNSETLDKAIDIRLQTWNMGYRSRTLASLLANNYQTYALEYIDANGSYETIKYYYYLSIKWSWEYTSFDSTYEDDRVEIIRYIAMRYHDIASVAPTGSREQKRAELICNTLRDIAHEIAKRS